MLVTFNIADETYEKIKENAHRKQISVSGLIRMTMIKRLENESGQ